MQLYQFVAIFGILMLVFVQIPSFHSLRHVNLISLVLCLAYSACATAGSIYIGHSTNAPEKVYSVSGHRQDRIFGSFNAISIIATTYGNGIIPEIQDPNIPPRFRHQRLRQPTLESPLWPFQAASPQVVPSAIVAISGYWAFGNQAQVTVLSNFLVDGKPLLPTWVLLIAAVASVNLQPTNEVLERKFVDPKIDQFSIGNTVRRLVFRSLSVVIATTVAAMFPFFGDINAVIGAFGCIPLDFILPMIFYNVTFKPSKNSLIFWGNTAIASIYSALGALGAISSNRQIVLDANKYSFFANI
ncbi:hypothetical protein L484_016809 [Morus notabilis]|uniref:Amino acid transporter transmembrane domain-containing protein n=1 Tax=Morus notabilis TaxID=981085 RepID=W9STB1_9ROSA|nr:hypothetical protein L484_016809 [Morus notabilis]